MRDIRCINILAMYKSAKCTFFILSGGGLGSVSPGFAACLVFTKRWTSCNYFRKGI
jgi:hypothetical protein